jgi:hypothetical protein
LRKIPPALPFHFSKGPWQLATAGFVDAYRLHHPEPGRYTWCDYRAGNFHNNFGMRIDHLLVTTSLRHRVVWAEIDREARKGKPIPSDQAQLVMGFVHAFQKKTQKTPPHELAVGEKFKGSGLPRL